MKHKQQLIESLKKFIIELSPNETLKEGNTYLAMYEAKILTDCIALLKVLEGD